MMEKDMSPAVEAWLVSCTFGVVCEPSLPVLGTIRRAVDVVGWNSRAIVAIELKLRLTEEAIMQAMQCSYGADLVWCCVQDASPAMLELAASRGVGVLIWHPGLVPSVKLAGVPAPHFPAVKRSMEWRKILSRAHVDMMGGSKGSASGRKTQELLIEYAKSNPGASWRKAHREVPSTCASFVDLRRRFGKSLKEQGLSLANG